MDSEEYEGAIPRRSKLNKSMDTLFPQQASDRCRVCNEDVVDGRWNYCSERCRELAQAVQKMFIWDTVRERVKERDGHTCQECGLSKEMWSRAYWQVQERMDERNPHESAEDHDAWYEERQRLRRLYDVDAPYSGGYHVDHIQRIADGGHPFDETNLQTLCKHCHHEKTAEENAADEAAPDITLEDYLEA